MEIMFKIPLWFADYVSFMELFFALVCFLVAFYAYKIYKISKEREIKLFSISFFMISISYIAWPIKDFFATYSVNNLHLRLLTENIDLVRFVFSYTHVLFFIAGLTTLLYMTFRKEDKRLYFSLLSINLIPILIAIEKINYVYTISTILIFFILIYYYRIYTKSGNKKILTFFLSFLILFLASIDLIFSDTKDIYYVGGHVLMLISYLLIFIRLAINYRKWQKKEIN